MDSKLLDVRCDNCGAEYRISSRGEMVCRFCGSNVYLSDKDFAAYKNTRDNMLMSDRFTNDEAADTGDVLHLWDGIAAIARNDVVDDDGQLRVYHEVVGLSMDVQEGEWLGT